MKITVINASSQVQWINYNSNAPDSWMRAKDPFTIYTGVDCPPAIEAIIPQEVRSMAYNPGSVTVKYINGQLVIV